MGLSILWMQFLLAFSTPIVVSTDDKLKTNVIEKTQMKGGADADEEERKTFTAGRHWNIYEKNDVEMHVENTLARNSLSIRFEKRKKKRVRQARIRNSGTPIVQRGRKREGKSQLKLAFQDLETQGNAKTVKIWH